MLYTALHLLNIVKACSFTVKQGDLFNFNNNLTKFTVLSVLSMSLTVSIFMLLHMNPTYNFLGKFKKIEPHNCFKIFTKSYIPCRCA